MRKSFLVAIAMLFFLNAHSDTGCRSNSTGSVYNNPDGFFSPGVLEFEYRVASDRVAAASIKCFTNSSTPCHVTSYDPNFNSVSGTLVTFSTNASECPIDDYIPYGLFVIGAIGFFKLSGQNFMIFKSYNLF